MTNPNRPMLRIGLNIGWIALILFLTLSNTQSLISWHPNHVSMLYLHGILFSSITFLAIAINNLYLLPQLLFQKKRLVYVVCLILLLLLTTIVSSSYLQYLFRTYPHGTLDHFTLFAIEFHYKKNPLLEKYLIALVPTCFYIISFALAYIIRHLFNKNKKLQLTKEEQLTAELNLLKAQVNPHFLFNMMNSIYSLSLNKSDDAPEVILKLSEILRYNLYETANQWVLLSKELHIIETYLSLESIRLEHPQNISFQNKVPSNAILIAPMLLLPIVENAFKHGIDSNIEQGFITITAHNLNDHFVFTCSNNYKPKEHKNDHSGLGLDNLRRRLQLLYPNGHTLEILTTDTTFEVVLQIKTKQ